MNVVNTSSTTPGYTLPNSGTFTISSDTVPCTSAEMTDATTTECYEENSTKTVNATVTPDIFLFFNDGSMFGFLKSSTECKSGHSCYGIIDVNGAKGPNKVATASNVTDIYLVEYYDQTIKPATDDAAAVLYGK